MITTEKQSFFYEDNRFDWQTLSAGSFTVFWYEGDLDFAQEILNAALAGIDRAQRLLPTQLAPQAHFRIYAYGTARDLQSTLQRSGRSWIAAHADPDSHADGHMDVDADAHPYTHSHTHKHSKAAHVDCHSERYGHPDAPGKAALPAAGRWRTVPPRSRA